MGSQRDQLKTSITIAACALALTACAQGFDASDRFEASQYATGYSPIRDGEDPNGPWICPTDYNVKPLHDRELDGTGHYAACYARSSLYDIRIDSAHSSPPETICAFPVQVIDESTSFLKPDLETGRPLSLCSKFIEGRAFFTFDLIKYNAVILVPSTSREAMTSCLETGQAAYCPPYSYGKFRQNQ